MSGIQEESLPTTQKTTQSCALSHKVSKSTSRIDGYGEVNLFIHKYLREKNAAETIALLPWSVVKEGF